MWVMFSLSLVTWYGGYLVRYDTLHVYVRGRRASSLSSEHNRAFSREGWPAAAPRVSLLLFCTLARSM